MPCSVCNHVALNCLLASTEAARTGGLRSRDIRYLTIETSRRLAHIISFTSRNQSAGTSPISTFHTSRIRDLYPTPYSIENPRRGKERFHHYKDGSTISGEYSTEIHKHLGEAMQAVTAPILLRAKQDSMISKAFLKSRPSLKNKASAVLRKTVKGLEQRGDPLSRWPKDSIREENHGSASSPGRVRLRDYSSKNRVASQGGMRSSPNTKRFTNMQNGTQGYKDRRKPWQTQKRALSEKFGSAGWLPRKRLSPDTLEGIRVLHAQYPDKFTTPILADQFEVSPEAIRRILKSKWRPKDEEEERRRRRWEKRGENIWSQMIEMGIKPPRKWREKGVGKSSERKPTQGNQLESQIRSNFKRSSPPVQSTIDLHTVTANRHESGSPVLVADRIL